MKIKISDQLRVQLARVYLDNAEKTRLHSDTIDTLKRIRKRQRQESADAYSKTRPPQGVEFQYLSIRLFEVFQLEDFDKLASGVKRLFPELEKNPLNQN